MKTKLCLITIGTILLFVLAGCGKSKLETENDELKIQIAKSESENSQLKIESALLKQETNELGSKITEDTKQLQEAKQEQEEKSVAVTKLETDNAGLKSSLDSLNQKIAEMEQKKAQEDAQEIEQSQKEKSKMINADLENVIVHLERLQKEPKDFAKPLAEDREAEADRLKQLASSEESEIQQIIIKLEGEGFTKKSDLQNLIDDFDKHYKESLFWWGLMNDRAYAVGNFEDSTVKADFSKSLTEDFAENDDIKTIKSFERPDQ